MAMVAFFSWSGHFTDPFLSGELNCFCTQDTVHTRIRNDSSEQVCVCVCLCVCVSVCVCIQVLLSFLLIKIPSFCLTNFVFFCWPQSNFSMRGSSQIPAHRERRDTITCCRRTSSSWAFKFLETTVSNAPGPLELCFLDISTKIGTAYFFVFVFGPFVLDMHINQERSGSQVHCRAQGQAWVGPQGMDDV